MRLLLAIYVLAAGIIPSGQSYLKQLQQRDSILIADQLEYGVEINGVAAGTTLAFQDYTRAFTDTLTLVRNWRIDTLKVTGRDADMKFNLRASVVVAPFEEGHYQLPDIAVQRTAGSQLDTLLFDGMEFEAKTIPIDTATFQIHDIKGQIKYPLTFAEILPYIIGIHLLALLAIVIGCLIIMSRRTRTVTEVRRDPPYIVALRDLDRLRGDKYWAPDKQKTLYSGITDTLRTYIENVFGINAEEMTTAEIFEALDGRVPDDLFAETKELFETADFVKFAKFSATEQQNAAAVPSAVKFVTSTYQTQLEGEQKEEEEAA
ncbi:MAG: hypothetical protein J6Y61_02735 [Bacteroidales bacterium]|nr:hypothetical protein [Bacteroidales bacterium]